MKSRLDDLPTFDTRRVTVRAFHYNRAQVALKRLGSPLRFVLPKRQSPLDLHLEKEAWIVVDTSLSDIPVMAWVDFDAIGRTSLHKDIPCTLKIYHSHADLLIEPILESMTMLIGERLNRPEYRQTCVLSLTKISQ